MMQGQTLTCALCGEHGFKAVPSLLKLVLEQRAWKCRIIVQTGEEFAGFPN